MLVALVCCTSHLAESQPQLQPCYNGETPVYCQPTSNTFTLERVPTVNSTCGTPRTNFCERTVSLGQTSSDCSAVCDADDPQFRHPPSYMTDFLLGNTWWQSENSLETDHAVVIDFSLGTLVEVDVINFIFYSFTPANFRILKSEDYGLTYTDFHYFAASCIQSYSIPPSSILTYANETSVLCQSIRESHFPGPISFIPLVGRPSANDSIPGLSNALYSFISATNIRVVLAEHYSIPNLASDDLGFFYALRDVNLIGTCQCNGHGNDCEAFSDPFLPATFSCVCFHNTTGINCERCKDFYQDVPWQRVNGSNTFECLRKLLLY